ncbi:hypothetical protein DB347_17655 [Opitutaceae bacterium EW11]|nr:hypothetical protein DB347_17655 [Opitutaceae bacterium EW11]
MLAIRFECLRKGGTVEEAAAIAAAELQMEATEVLALYRKDGFEPLPVFRKGARKEAPWRSTNENDYGVIGLKSSSRRFQRSKTWWANFAHSLQGFWDLRCDEQTALKGCLEFPELAPFVEQFRKECSVSGHDWLEEIRKDIHRCCERFANRGALAKVSEQCLRGVREALEKLESANAVAIAKVAGYCVRQIKNALYELAKLGEVSRTGTAKGQKWSLTAKGRARLPCNTVSMTCKERVDLSVPFAFLLFAPGRVWRKPQGCPRNHRPTRTMAQYRAEQAARKAATAARRAEAKAVQTRQCIEQMDISDRARAFWSLDHGAFRRAHSTWAFLKKQGRTSFTWDHYADWKGRRMAAAEAT